MAICKIKKFQSKPVRGEVIFSKVRKGGVCGGGQRIGGMEKYKGFDGKRGYLS